MTTPRYVLPNLQPVGVYAWAEYELPIVPERRTSPVAVVIVAAPNCTAALVRALEWAAALSEKKDYPHYPQVRYGKHRMEVRKIEGTGAYLEGAGRGKWVPAAALCS